MTSIGIRIQELRKQHQMTQEDLAERLDVTRQVISKWERDQSVPSTDVVIQLSRIFGVSTDYILGVGPLSESKKENAVDMKSVEGQGSAKIQESALIQESADGNSAADSWKTFAGKTIVENSEMSKGISASQDKETKPSLSAWLAFLFAGVAFIFAIRFLVEMNMDDGGGISFTFVPGIMVAFLVVLAWILKIASAVRRRWSKRVSEYVVSYLTFLLSISAGVWSVFLILFPAMDIYGSPFWAVWIIEVVTLYTAIAMAIVYFVIVIIRKKLRKREA